MKDFLELVLFIIAILFIGAFLTMAPSCSEILRDHGVVGVASKVICGKVSCTENKPVEPKKE
jgi:hypothetical protein